MLRVALTGGIATGKSYVLVRLASAGVPTLDADALVHEALAAGSPAIRSIASRFGAGVVAADGSIDRKTLGRIVFADARAREDLEAILHPEIYRRIDEWFASLGADRSPRVRESRRRSVGQAEDPKVNCPGFAVADIPLLFETGHEPFFDRVIVTACSPAQQIERMKQRNGLGEDEARKRMAAQWPIEEKVRRAHFVIDTSGSFEETDRQVDRVVAKLGAGDWGLGTGRSNLA